MHQIYVSKNNILFTASNRGFSTLEILIAMAVLILCLSAIISVSFGSQSILIDSQVSSEAINKAQELLEKAQADARIDFKIVNPIPQYTDPSDGYQKKVDVDLWKDPITDLPDFFTKEVKATVSWTGEYNRNLNVQLVTLVTNFENAIGGDTCNSVLSGRWDQANVSSLFVSNVDSNSSLSLDVYNRKLYLAVSNANTNDTPTLFVYSLADPKNPIATTSLDNDDNIREGISDIHATDKYLYAAKATSSGQLQIFDITGSIPVKVGNDFSIPGVIGTGNQAIGKSIFYKDGYIYLGLTETGSGPEFNIIDVHKFPTSGPSLVGSYKVGKDINSIYVKGRYAYLAHPANSSSTNIEELTVLNITNPTDPKRIDGYDAPDNIGYGKSIYLVGDNLYFGRTATDLNPEFYILHNSDSNPISATSSQEISSDVNGLIIRDYLAFLITDSQFQIWRIDNPASIISYYSTFLDGGTSLDCEGNYLYAGSVNSANKGYLSVISTP